MVDGSRFEICLSLKALNFLCSGVGIDAGFQKFHVCISGVLRYFEMSLYE